MSITHPGSLIPNLSTSGSTNPSHLKRGPSAMFYIHHHRLRGAVCTAICLALCTFGAACHAASPQPDHVVLTESTTTWKTVKYATDNENGFVDGSLDIHTIVDRQFRTYVIENRFLKVTLLPDFGGRILSIIFKPTGHEELYRTDVGVPFGIKDGTYYYDWMIVYGGIIPTLPSPEHGKTWLKPWDFKVVSHDDSEVTVSMSLDDNFAYAAAPKQYQRGSSGLQATYQITLKADRAALDTRMILENPSANPIDYEYWTCTTLAPGSDAHHPMATGGAEIVGPIDSFTTPQWSNNLTKNDKSTGPNQSQFKQLRYFKNWPTMGIAYASPDMQGGNFWGVINHDNKEGIVRIADNAITPGLKMWTWGFPSIANDAKARQAPDPAQPYIELWAGVSDQFSHRSRMPAFGEVVTAEIYGPTVGMNDVTDANEHILVNLSATRSQVSLEFVSFEPDKPLSVLLKQGETILFEQPVNVDQIHGNRVTAPLSNGQSSSRIEAIISAGDGTPLIHAETTIK